MEINGQEVKVGQVRDDWALALMERGVIVKLTMSRWRASSKLKYEELGIIFSDSENKSFMSKYVKLGSEKLFPPDILRELEHLESRARRCLSYHSFQTIWGKFLPYSNFTNWKIENDEVKKDFFDFAKIIDNNYNEIVKEVKDDYKRMAVDVWKRLYPNDGKDPSLSFVESFSSRIVNKIPSREDIFESFKYETTFFTIPLPSVVQEDLAKAEKISRDMEIMAMNQIIEIETKRIIADNYIEKKREMIDSFLESTVTYLRHHIAELADHTYQVLQRSEKQINLAHVKKIKKMIKQVKHLNFYNDEEMEKILNDLLSEVSRYKGDRDKLVIQNKLRELVDLSKTEYMPEGFNPIIDIIDIN